MSATPGALLVCLAVLSYSLRARAELEIVPAADGHLGAWLLAGPLAAGARLEPAAPSVEPTSSGLHWRPIAVADGAIDVARELGAGDAPDLVAALGGRLRLAEDLDGWLLLGADGASSVLIDGRAVWSRDEPHLRSTSWDPIRLRLPRGDHTLVVRLARRGPDWGFAARLLDAAALLPPRGAALALPGLDDAQADRIASRMLNVVLRRGTEPGGFRPRVAIEARRGARRDRAIEASAVVRRGHEPLLRASLGRLPVGERGAHGLEALLGPIHAAELGDAETLSVEIRVADVVVKRELSVSAAAARAAERAERLRRALVGGEHAHLSDRETLLATLEHRLNALEHADTGSAAALAPRTRALEELLDRVSGGGDPLHDPGVLMLARRSRIDGEPDPLLIHVPRGHARGQAERWPLVVLLHGLDGTPESVMRAFLDRPLDSAHPAVRGFVIAPHAHGNAFYRGAAEREVLDALDWATATYPVDLARVTIAGASMGGTGAAWIALRHASRFAAASPLCGYHSFFARRDTSHRPLRPWEELLMHQLSAASWAANGRNLPLWVVHGKRDLPLENSRALVDRYRQLGYRVIDDWPEAGHGVWEIAWDGARAWPWLERWRRDPEPPRVTLETPSLGRAELDWVRITALGRPGAMGRLDARVTGPAALAVTTENVAGFELRRPARHLVANAAVRVVVDSSELDFAPGERLQLARDGAAWKKGVATPPSGHKRAGAEGPIRDVWEGPAAFVYGTLDPATTRANREVAESFARMRLGAELSLPVLADVEVDATLERERSLFLVGGPASNRIVRELGALPFRLEGGAIQLGERRWQAPELGAIFIHPNPRQPERSIVVVLAPTAAGIWRALSLPNLLPDFVVWDAALARASGEQVLGHARVLSAGFFGHDWRPPPALDDAPAIRRGTP